MQLTFFLFIDPVEVRVNEVVRSFVSGEGGYIDHNNAQTNYGTRAETAGRRMLRDPGCVVMVERPHIKSKRVGLDYLEY